MKNVEESLENIPKIFSISMVIIILVHIVFLVLKYVFGFEDGLVYRLSFHFHLDGEQNIPAWFSTLILLNCSLLLYIIYRISKDVKPDKFWLLLSVIFLCLSMDEMNSLHERLIGPLREALNLSGYFYFAWIVVGMAFVLVVGLISIPFLKTLPPKAALHFIVAGFIYILGAIGMEMIGGQEAYLVALSDQGGNMQNRGPLYSFIITVEETLEMSGIVFFNYVLIRYIKFQGSSENIY